MNRFLFLLLITSLLSLLPGCTTRPDLAKEKKQIIDLLQTELSTNK